MFSRLLIRQFNKLSKQPIVPQGYQTPLGYKEFSFVENAYHSSIAVCSLIGACIISKESIRKEDSLPEKIIGGTGGALIGGIVGFGFGLISPFLIISVPVIAISSIWDKIEK